VETPGLLPEDEPLELAERLELHPPTVSLALIGHEPHLGALASLLVRGKARPGLFNVKKAAVLALEPTGDLHKSNGRPRWRVSWHIVPALLPQLVVQPATTASFLNS
jgi:phosphohistidine phosphatase